MRRRMFPAVLGAWLLALGAAGSSPAAAVAPPRIEENPLTCLALNIYWESRSEGEEGQLAIAFVTLNRAASEEFPHDICGVVTEGGERPLGRCQFRWWCDGKPDAPLNEEAWASALRIARLAISGQRPDPTGGALYFHNLGVKPGWASRRHYLVTIGQHVFYR